jgi:hypothetical protein
MRQYGILTPQRWIGNTGKKLRRGIQSRSKGDPLREAYKDAQIVADMLVVNPNATMYGLYYITRATMADLTGLDVGEVDGALRILEEERFAAYDDTSEFVWVREMARIQMFLPLKPGDRNVKPARAWYRGLPRNPFLGDFYDKYGEALHLEDRRDEWRSERLPLESSATDEALAQGPSMFDQWFLIFLEAYPSARRVGGAAGEEAFRRAMRGRDESHLNLLLDALWAQQHSEQWRGGVIPGMVRWLDEEQWRRDLPRGRAGPGMRGNFAPEGCTHGCSGPGQHAMRVQLEKVCGHVPACASWIEHYNAEGVTHE